MQITSKLPDVGVTIFSVMTQMANQHGAVNLSQGFPDFDPHPELVAEVNRQMTAGHNQYAPMQGVLELREQIAAKTETLHGAVYHPDAEITVTAGATEALFAAVTAVVRPGDDVIVLEPAYDAYGPAVRLSGGRPVPVSLQHPGYTIDWPALDAALSDRTRLIIFNTPHNPSGTLLSAQDMTRLEQRLDGTGVLILSDEAYEHIIFDGQVHQSACRFPGLKERAFVVCSFGKTYHTTGWKVGYCLAPEVLTTELRRVHQFITFAVNTPVQHAYARLLARTDLYLELGAFYQAKRDRFMHLLEGSRFTGRPAGGTFFQMMDYSRISDEGDVAFARRMVAEHGVAAIPPSVFYTNGDDHRVLRFCFAKKDETLEKAAEILCRI